MTPTTWSCTMSCATPQLLSNQPTAVSSTATAATKSKKPAQATERGKHYRGVRCLPWHGRSSLLRSEREVCGESFWTPHWPMIAAVTGHAAAAGFILTLCHDCVVMRKDGFQYMSEMDISLVIPDYFMAVVRGKRVAVGVRTEVALRAANVAAERGGDGDRSAAEKVEGVVRLEEELVQSHTVWLGTFETAEDAALAYTRTAYQIRGRTLCLNFPLRIAMASHRQHRLQSSSSVGTEK